MFWMLPLYLSFAWSEVVYMACTTYAPHRHLWLGTMAIFGSKPVFSMLLVEHNTGMWEETTALCFCLALLRWLADFLGVLAIAALGCRVAARARGTGKGLLVTWLTVLALFIFVFNLHDWVVLVLWPRWEFGHAMNLGQVLYMLSVDDSDFGPVYGLLAMLSLALEIGATWWALRGLARNFDAYALAEKAHPSPRPSPPRGEGV
jgi:hypothetical protein